MSKILLSNPKYSRISSPIGASSGNSSKPSTTSGRSISEAPHSMPCDSTPRSLLFLILKPLPSSLGKLAPMVATGARIPTRTFGAPQTICSGASVLILTCVTRSLSASGCGSTLITSPTTTPLKSAATASISSISRPAIVS